MTEARAFAWTYFEINNYDFLSISGLSPVFVVKEEKEGYVLYGLSDENNWYQIGISEIELFSKDSIVLRERIANYKRFNKVN